MLGVTYFHVLKHCVWLEIVFGRSGVLYMVGTAAVWPAVYIGCIFCILGVIFLCLVLHTLFLICCCCVIGIWDCLYFEWVVRVGFGWESQWLHLTALSVSCCGISGCAVVQMHLGQLLLVPGAVQFHVGRYIRHCICWYWYTPLILLYHTAVPFCSWIELQWGLIWSWTIFGLLLIWHYIFYCIRKNICKGDDDFSNADELFQSFRGAV